MLCYAVLTLALAAWASAKEDGSEMTQMSAPDSSQMTTMLAPDLYLFNLGEFPTAKCDNMTHPEPFQYIKYYLFTRTEPFRYELRLDDRGRSLKYSSFNSLKETKFVVHGWLQHPDEYLAFVYDYLTVDNYNVILMDWSEFAKKCDFESTHQYVVEVASKSAGTMLRKLVSYGAHSMDFHLIGFSVGVHIAGIAAKSLTPNRVGRITALNPSGYLFDHAGYGKIQNGDANYVDVIYTTMKSLASEREFGDVIFYPNGGTHPQPNTTTEHVGVSHLRAIEYFRESITRPKAFVARKCDNDENFRSGRCDNNEKNYMGEYSYPKNRGKFYLRTNGQKPYGQGEIQHYFAARNRQ